MRIDIKTSKPVTDNCVKALYIINFALSLVEERMIVPTLQFFADKYGFQLVRK